MVSDAEKATTKKRKFFTLNEFQGKFGYTREEALYEIAEHNIKAWYKVPGMRTLIPREWVSYNCADAQITSIPTEEVERYAAIIASRKPPVSLTHPCLDSSHPFYSEELALAIRSWEYAILNKPTKSNFSVKIDSFLDKQNAGENVRGRIKTVCNPFKRGPRRK